MQQVLTISQIVISLSLIITVLLQQRGAGGGSLFGGGGGSDTSYYTKRGFEKILFTVSIILAALFLISSFLNLLI
ncbi:preprotein translocase subunit SecG [Patescibacteria group bacterium]|nr:preprotein translocase subunit SecG [Patescibacteria group bacterium]MBU1563781.1 preprotein translocase subunit SecG [Patescibacteria group bacterium]MBU2068387.1 preprotein translocase subunit SecG [Patescibacteria group bacterium]